MYTVIYKDRYGLSCRERGFTREGALNRVKDLALEGIRAQIIRE